MIIDAGEEKNNDMGYSSYMRVILFSYEYPPIGGGIATAVFHILKAIGENHPDIQIDCITSSVTNTWEKKELYPNVNIHFVPIGNKIHSLKTQTPLNMAAYFLFATLKALELRAQGQIQLTHAFGYPGPFPSFLLSLIGIPYIVSLRGVDVPGYNKKFGWWYKLYSPLVRITWNRAKSINANSYVLQDLAQRITQKPIEIIPNGVDTTIFKPLPASKKFKRFTVTGGGTLMNPKKRVHLLVEGFAHFVSKAKLAPTATQLLLIGNGPERERIERLVDDLDIREYVTFTGEKSHEWLQDNLPKCHVFCLMSQAESNSNAVLEAAACGLPLVLSEGIGNLAFMEKGTALVVNSNSEITNVSNYLNQIYRDKNLTKKLHQNSLHYSDLFNWHTVCQKIINEWLIN